MTEHELRESNVVTLGTQHALGILALAVLLFSGDACRSMNHGQGQMVALASCDRISKAGGDPPGPLPSQQPSWVEAGLILGTVADNRTGAAISDATVRFSGSTTNAVLTDARGVFSSGSLPAGIYHVLIRRIGYQSIQDSLVVMTGTVDTVAYRLQYRSCP